MKTMTTTSPTTADLGSQLESLLERQLSAHAEWRRVVQSHKEAISAADPRAIAIATEQQAAMVRRVHDLEEERQRTLGTATVTELIRTLPAADRARLTEMAERLKALAVEIRDEQRLVRTASENLMTHMRGLMSQIAARLSHAGTYGAGGRVESSATVVSGLDISR